MAPPPAIKKAIGALKDKASIAFAKVAGTVTQSSPEPEILVLKSTSHDEEEPALALETHARSIAAMTHASRRHVTALVAAMSKRLRKTRNPTVALKCLALVHRVAAEGHHSFAEEIRATFRGIDDVAENFKDDDDDYSNSFLRCFAAYLDERVKETWLETARERLGRLVRTLDLAAALRPTIPAAAKTGSVAVVALGRVVEESFAVFSEVSEASRALEKQAARMGPEEMKKALEICDGAARTIRELAGFYGWCRDIGVALPQKLQEMELQEIKEPEIRAQITEVIIFRLNWVNH